jgi:flagellar biosynthetic protein FliR
MDLASFGIQKLITFVLVLVRSAGIFTLTPIFGANQVPMYARLVIALALALVFLPIVAPPNDFAMEALPVALMVAREACVGLVIGFVCTMVFTAIEIAGQLIDVHAGFSFATMLDPVNGANSAVAARFHRLVAGLLFFATNAHHVMIRGLADSFRVAPVGQLTLNASVAGGAVDLFAALFVVAIRIAVPVVAAVFLADVALAITARVVPQMNVLFVGFPLKLGVGLVGMIVALPVLAAMSQNLFGDIYNQTLALVSLVAR